MATRIACALAAYPLGWTVREALGGGAGGVVVLALIAGAAWGLPRRRALAVALSGVACFAGVHLLASATSVSVGLGSGALVFALACWAWAGSSSRPRATPAA